MLFGAFIHDSDVYRMKEAWALCTTNVFNIKNRKAEKYGIDWVRRQEKKMKKRVCSGRANEGKRQTDGWNICKLIKNGHCIKVLAMNNIPFGKQRAADCHIHHGNKSTGTRHFLTWLHNYFGIFFSTAFVLMYGIEIAPPKNFRLKHRQQLCRRRKKWNVELICLCRCSNAA